MTDYLSPGVYIEETDSGNKPIEGVSTSIAGVVGVTERGPANVPTLVTSFADYRRTFGGYLSIGDFTDPGGRAHCYLPHAVEGLFVNGGKLLYVTRVESDGATRAQRRLFFDDPQAGNPLATVLLRPAEEDTGTSLNPPLLYVLSATGLSIGDTIRIGDGSRAEYRTIVNALAAPEVSLSLPLQQSHANGGSIYAGPITTTSGAFALPLALNAGLTQFTVRSATPADVAALVGAPNQAMELGPTASAEFVLVVSTIQINATDVQVTLAAPTQLPHPVTDTAQIVSVPSGAAQLLTTAANGGDSILFVNVVGPTFTPGNVVVLDTGSFPNQEIRRIGTLTLLTPAVAPYEDYPLGSLIEHVAVADDTRNITVATSTTSVTLDNVALLVPGMQLVFATAAPTTSAILSIAGNVVTLMSPLGGIPSVSPPAVSVQPRTLTAPAAIGAMTIQLSARIGLGLDPKHADVLRIGIAPNHELVQVVQLSDPRAAPPDAGTVVLERPLQRAYPANTPVARETVTADVARPATTTLLDAPPTATELLVGDGTSYAVGDTIRVTTPDGDMFYHAIVDVDSTVEVKPSTIEVDVALVRSHNADSTIVKREQLFIARALDTGGWGNRLLITAADEETGLLGRAQLLAATASPSPGIPSTLRLSTVTGVEAGTVLELRDSTNTTQIGDFLKVNSIDKAANNLVLLDAPGLSAAQLAAFASAGSNRLVVRSREFRVQVLLLNPPQPAIPIRNNDLLDQELFRTLSMDPRHSHYFERVIGATWVEGLTVDDLGLPLRRSDNRSEGGSQYVRVQDLGTSEADKERVRLGPEDLTDTLPSGLTRPARLRLGDGEDLAVYGDDGVALMDDDTYIGVDDQEPANRTGIQALQNRLDISLIAVPGQVTAPIQQALIDQCESMLYRFAVLDAQGPADDDTIDDITAQRQQFDTKYAAFYHPWLTIPDPFPTNLQSIAQFPIPPSGHMLGIYARVDESRGVWKAPANEIVSGMTGLTRYLNQSEQDLLNAEPTNIDLIRDFRINNRGIRVWGARVITSDSDWKYINVRRLMIFIEDSLNIGLQWVVFEPNAEPLWARVRRTVSNFLTTTWRSGALEGTTKDQAFYVKCDRTTMTQDDIDNGRLICLVGVAPVKPAEFVIIRIGLWTADASS
ncbi:MAG TPA: phage tail sheath C-terminal domain-containing protein [Kofleriaceae bacterium]|jgi:hypothetical protein|nr:phage tail sheath C-terminal domain-containing protein [Kofleriaceae bacterium]